MREINAVGLALVKQWEGIPDGDSTTVNLEPYLDPVGIWTIGWGHAIRSVAGAFLRGASGAEHAKRLYPGGITTQQAEVLLRADLLDASRDVATLARMPLLDNEFAALVSFEFNSGGLNHSTLLQRLLENDFRAAGDEFLRWTKGRVDGKLVVLPGLVARRKAERMLFFQR